MSTYVNNLSFIQPVENQTIIATGGALLYVAPANTFARVQVHINLGEEITFFPTSVELKINGQTIYSGSDGPYFEFYSDLKIPAGGTVELFVDGPSFIFGSVTGASFTTEIDY